MFDKEELLEGIRQTKEEIFENEYIPANQQLEYAKKLINDLENYLREED